MVDEELVVRVAALARAVRDRDEMEARLRGCRTREARELSLAACEQVLQRRAGLYRCLIRQGWTPPADVVRHLLEDEVLLSEPLGEIGA